MSTKTTVECDRCRMPINPPGKAGNPRWIISFEREYAGKEAVPQYDLCDICYGAFGRFMLGENNEQQLTKLAKAATDLINYHKNNERAWLDHQGMFMAALVDAIPNNININEKN